MLYHTRPSPHEPVDRVAVLVTFLRMDKPPDSSTVAMPAGVTITLERLNVEAYRKLYDQVGAPWLWWLRRLMPDDALARHLANPEISIHILRFEGEVAGFYETDATLWPEVNLNYFGLMPNMIGKGLGKVMLSSVITTVFSSSSPLRSLTVNTCTADHPRALPNYLTAGFVEMRRVRELWEIPSRLGFAVPEHLRV